MDSRERIMNYKKIKKYLSILVIISGCLSFTWLIRDIGGGGILNDCDLILENMEALEKNPSAPITNHMKKEIELWKDTAELKDYIKYSEKQQDSVEKYLVKFSLLFLISLSLRIIAGVVFRLKKPYKEANDF
jgi:hypothetical protein